MVYHKKPFPYSTIVMFSKLKYQKLKIGKSGMPIPVISSSVAPVFTKLPISVFL